VVHLPSGVPDSTVSEYKERCSGASASAASRSALQSRARLPGQSVDQVDRDVVEAGATEQLHRDRNLLRV
jgi:hypothetical protein